MRPLENILEGSEDGEEYVVTFSNGNKLGLKDFEMVSELVYERADLCVAEVVSQIKCDKRFYTVGTGIEFSLNDVINVCSPKNEEIIWRCQDLG